MAYKNPEANTGILNIWQLSQPRYLGGGQNKHWSVRTSTGVEVVLRRYKEDPFDDLDYEFTVMRQLREEGWPIAEMLEEPIEHSGRLWCLISKLPGEGTNERSPQQQRRRGRLLAELHQSTSNLTDMGQRRGFSLPDQILANPELLTAIKKYESFRPDRGYILRWHLERALNRLSDLDSSSADKLVLHSDFTSWNVLYTGNTLTSILDFEATHLNYRVTDFALSWRGCYDEVINGYQEVHPLSELDRHLLIPTFWSWLFLGVREWINQIGEAGLREEDFAWQIKQLSRRSLLFGDLSEPCPVQP